MITVEEAQANLWDLIQQLAPGEEIIITRNQQPVAKLVSERPPEHQPRVPGNCKGMIVLAVEDEEHLKDFEEYLP
jgi:antitoxin (DNA-binding transcriptional repressor) of toxin-antitoxin stability system